MEKPNIPPQHSIVDAEEANRLLEIDVRYANSIHPDILSDEMIHKVLVGKHQLARLSIKPKGKHFITNDDEAATLLTEGYENVYFINPDIFTPSELQMIFCIVPLDVVTDRITDISNKIYKIKGLKAYIFDKHMYDTLIIFNQEIQTELKSELAISFAKLILSRIPIKYLTNF
jgi:hypothetical protein